MTCCFDDTTPVLKPVQAVVEAGVLDLQAARMVTTNVLMTDAELLQGHSTVRFVKRF